MAKYPDDLDRWRRAARISAEARNRGARAVVPGATRRAVADEVESYIRAQGAEPAFPTNLSRNVEAAHYTPSPDDDVRFVEGDIVKVDVGAHLDGAIADTAVTVEVGSSHRQDRLLKAARDAVEAGIAEVRAGVAVDDLSKAIERAIHSGGFKPIENLTGHSIERYLLHAGKSIPNASGMSTDRLEEGEVVAIEPFATNGAGGSRTGRSATSSGSGRTPDRPRRRPGAGSRGSGPSRSRRAGCLQRSGPRSRASDASCRATRSSSRPGAGSWRRRSTRSS